MHTIEDNQGIDKDKDKKTVSCHLSFAYSSYPNSIHLDSHNARFRPGGLKRGAVERSGL